MNVPLPPLSAIPAVSSPAATDVGERAHRFGAGLVGVLSVPRHRPAQRTALILFNAGLVHRIGPFRGYVQLARRAAAQGFAVLRFDQAGLGDSPASNQDVAPSRQDMLDAAIALLASEVGADRFILGGICSGADDAYHLGACDPRVAGVVLLDGLAYRTAGYWARYVARRLFDPRKWITRLIRRERRQPGMDVYRDYPAQSIARQQLAAMVARDLRLLFVFTGAAYRYFNHPGQLAGCLGAAAHASTVSLHHWRDCDHTFYLRCHRERLQETLLSWLHSNFDDGAILTAPLADGRSASSPELTA